MTNDYTIINDDIGFMADNRTVRPLESKRSHFKNNHGLGIIKSLIDLSHHSEKETDGRQKKS